MLVLSRKKEEGIRIGGTIEVRILGIQTLDSSGKRRSKVASIGIEAPREISILRRELKETREANLAAQQSLQNLAAGGLAALLKKKKTISLPPEE